eukprot:evm.model.scf_1640.2 EVM.evm.TU.scf_1640.2   scf_1640:28969-31942(-)
MGGQPEGGSDGTEGLGPGSQRADAEKSIMPTLGVGAERWESVGRLGAERSGLMKPACEEGEKGVVAGGQADGPQKAFQEGGLWKVLQQQGGAQRAQSGVPGAEGGSFCELKSGGFAAWDRGGGDKDLERRGSAARSDWTGAGQSEATEASLRHRQAVAQAGDPAGGAGGGVVMSQQAARAAMGQEGWQRVRSVMLKQQEQFTNQLWELHRLHWRQGFLEAAQRLGVQAGCDAQRGAERPAAAQPPALQQPQAQYSQNLTQFLHQVLGESSRWGQAKADAGIPGQGQAWLGRPCPPPLPFAQQSGRPPFVLPGYGASLGGGPVAGPSAGPSGVPENSVPVMPPPVNDPHALWYAKHYGASAKGGPWPQQSSGGDEQAEGAPSAGPSGLDAASALAPAPLGPMTGAAVAAAVKAVTEANPPRWWQDAARVFGDVLMTSQQVPGPSCKPKPQGHRREGQMASLLKKGWRHSKRAPKRERTPIAKEKECSNGAMVEVSAENSTGSSRQAPLVQEEPLGTKKCGVACVKKVSKRKSGKRASHSSRLIKKSRRSRPSQAESIGSDLSGTHNDVEDDDAVHAAGGETGGQGWDLSRSPKEATRHLEVGVRGH